jgi:aminoglycoside phosphotransferase (APT) family kinase protein
MDDAAKAMKALINEAFPDLNVRTLTKLGVGKAGALFLANGEIVFKTPLAKARISSESAVPDPSHSELLLEYKVLSALYGKVEIAIPQPLFFGTLPDGRAVLGESLVPGTQFSQDAYEAFTQNEKNALFEQIGDILHQIHSADIPPIPEAYVHGVEENIGYFHDYHKDIVKNELTTAENEKVESIYRDFRMAAAAGPFPSVLCHGDVHFWNLNYDPVTKRICGLLDFGIANYNDPLNDMRYYWSDSVTKMLRKYPNNPGENAGTRHLFYWMCNLLEEVHDGLANDGRSDYLIHLKEGLFQKPL